MVALSIATFATLQFTIFGMLSGLSDVGASKKVELGNQAREVLREFEREEEFARGAGTPTSFAKPTGPKRRFTQSTQPTDELARDSRLAAKLQERETSGRERSYELVVTGGDNDSGRLKSTEIITSTGVCNPIPPKSIPQLPVAISAGEMTFMMGSLVFCGGSPTFIDHTHPIDEWGATNLCYSLPTADPTAWLDNSVEEMGQARAWFSLTKISASEMIAVGGIDNSGVATNTMAKYSFKTNTWSQLPKTLDAARFGHCTVHYKKGKKSYLIVIGGSRGVNPGESWFAVNTVYKVNAATGQSIQLEDLPEPLYRPACTIKEGDIYVSGGAQGDGGAPPAGKAVYRYSFVSETWNTEEPLNNERWGHVMGIVGASANKKISVAGGFTQTNFLASVEDSIDDAATWTDRATNLQVAREYAAATEVPANTFSCQD